MNATNNATTPMPEVDAVNPKLQYLETKLITLELENFRMVWLEMCHFAQ